MRQPRPRPPLDSSALDELALRYVGRFATTRARLAAYLSRKVRERGWSGERQPDCAEIADKMARLGYVDDAAYALSKSRSLGGRGYGPRRVRQSLAAAGIGQEDARPAHELAVDERVDSALKFARRRRLGPFAESELDRPARERALAAMIRAGHDFALARAILALAPGAPIDLDALAGSR